MAILPTVGMLRGTPIETMSLKAKIEAVIYASEEPVTLAQLTGLLGHEAQAELDHLDAAQQSLTLEEEPADPDALNHEMLSQTEAEHPSAPDPPLPPPPTPSPTPPPPAPSSPRSRRGSPPCRRSRPSLSSLTSSPSPPPRSPRSAASTRAASSAH